MFLAVDRRTHDGLLSLPNKSKRILQNEERKTHGKTSG
jgi:hypothetical protein